MLSAGLFTFFIRGFIGNYIERILLNYLSQRKAQWGQVVLYGFAFLYSFSQLNQGKRLNINHMINPRDYNGEIMMQLTLKYYPHKVNQEKFRQLMMDKYESQIIKINSFEHLMNGGVGGHNDHYKLVSPDAVTSYIQ